MTIRNKWVQENLDERNGVADRSGPIGAGYGDKGYLDARQDYEDKVRGRSEDIEKKQIAEGQSAGADAAGGDKAQGGMSSKASAALQKAEIGNSGLDTVGNGLMAAGTVPTAASPYLLAAGLAVKVVSSGEKAKREQQEKTRLEYNERVARRQELMNRIAQMRIE